MSIEHVRDETVAMPSSTSGQCDYYPIVRNTLQLRVGTSIKIPREWFYVADNGHGDLLWKGRPFGFVDYAAGFMRFQRPAVGVVVIASYDFETVKMAKLSPFRAKVLAKITTYHEHPLSFWIAQELRANEMRVSKAMDWLDENGYITADNRPVKD